MMPTELQLDTIYFSSIMIVLAVVYDYVEYYSLYMIKRDREILRRIQMEEIKFALKEIERSNRLK